MPGWNDDFSTIPPWEYFNAEFQAMFFDEAVKRAGAINTVGGGAGVGLMLPAVGVNLETVTYINLYQQIIAANFQKFLDPSVPYAPTNVLGEANFETALVFWQEAAFFSAANITPVSFPPFRRMRPREVGSLTATSDLQGNPAVIGQKARYVSHDPFFGLDSPAGRIHKYTGTQWVLASSPDGPVDRLDSDATSPNTIQQGYFSPGDYWGSHLFTQIRDCFNLMVRTSPADYYRKVSREAGGVGTTVDAAKAAALANFVAVPISSNPDDWTIVPGQPFGETSVSTIYSYNDDFGAPPNVGDAVLNLEVYQPGAPVYTGCNQLVEVWIFTDSYFDNDAAFYDNGTGLSITHGDGLPYGTINITASDSPEISVAWLPPIGSPSTIPAWGPTDQQTYFPGIGGLNTNYGFSLERLHNYCRWDVPGGFRCAATT